MELRAGPGVGDWTPKAELPHPACPPEPSLWASPAHLSRPQALRQACHAVLTTWLPGSRPPPISCSRCGTWRGGQWSAPLKKGSWLTVGFAAIKFQDLLSARVGRPGGKASSKLYGQQTLQGTEVPAPYRVRELRARLVSDPHRLTLSHSYM